MTRVCNKLLGKAADPKRVTCFNLVSYDNYIQSTLIIIVNIKVSKQIVEKPQTQGGGLNAAAIGH
jgi:hypothetical protein